MRSLKIDGDQVEQLGILAAEIANRGMDGLSSAARENLAQLIGDNCELSLIVQFHPVFMVELVCNPASPELAAFTIARWTQEAPEAIKRLLN